MADSSSSWQESCRMLTEAGPGLGLERTFPREPQLRLSLQAALGSERVAASPATHAQGVQLSQRLAGVIAQAQTIDRIGKCPVVGITGLLNSGKSSLLASYLSPSGRRRVLRGSANNQGTHRFVLWLPELWWQDQSLLNLLTRYMNDLFGVAPELLSDDPAYAFAQYNGQLGDEWSADTDPLTVPLITYDAGLNELGLALLDCPDIQSAGLDGGPVAQGNRPLAAEEAMEHRRAILGRVGRLCSAFLVVSKLSSLHDETLIAILETLRDTMPGVRRILAVNKVKTRYAPEVVDEQSQGLVDQFKITEVYMAYDYRSHWAEQRLPPAPARLHMTDDDPLPIFFRAKRGTGSQTTAKVSQRTVGEADDASGKLTGVQPPQVECYLQELSRLLDPGSLVIESRRSVAEQLLNQTQTALQWLDVCRAEREKQLHEAWQMLADACLAFMAQRDANDQMIGLRLQTSPAIVAQMSDSLVRAAPVSMRLSLMIDRSVRQLQTSIVGGVRRMRWLQSISSGVSQFVSSFRKGQTGRVVTAERFRQQLEHNDRRMILASWSTEFLTAACEQTLSRFQQEDTARLDQAWLDRWSAHVWQHMPLKQKLYVGMMPLAPIFGPLLAVTLIPFDGGGTAVLVFATTKELLLAAGIAAIATPAISGSEVQDIVERETALAQLSELFAIACDSFAVPRPRADQLPKVKVAGSVRQLAESKLPVKAGSDSESLMLWQLATGYRQSLIQRLNDLQAG